MGSGLLTLLGKNLSRKVGGGERFSCRDVLRTVWQAALRLGQRLVSRVLVPVMGERPQPTEPSQSTLKTIVNKQCWQGPETEISTHRPEDGVCDNDRTQLVGTCPSSRITQTPAASQSHVALQVVWENPE